MSKPDTVPVPEAQPNRDGHDRNEEGGLAPLPGSKRVKQANHSRNNHGEGS